MEGITRESGGGVFVYCVIFCGRGKVRGEGECSIRKTNIKVFLSAEGQHKQFNKRYFKIDQL